MQKTEFLENNSCGLQHTKSVPLGRGRLHRRTRDILDLLKLAKYALQLCGRYPTAGVRDDDFDGDVIGGSKPRRFLERAAYDRDGALRRVFDCNLGQSPFQSGQIQRTSVRCQIRDDSPDLPCVPNHHVRAATEVEMEVKTSSLCFVPVR